MLETIFIAFLMIIVLVIPIYVFIYGIYFYFYSDFNITKTSKIIILNFNWR